MKDLCVNQVHVDIFTEQQAKTRALMDLLRVPLLLSSARLSLGMWYRMQGGLFFDETQGAVTCGVQRGGLLRCEWSRSKGIFHDFVGGKTSCTPAPGAGPCTHALAPRMFWDVYQLSYGAGWIYPMERTLNPPIGSWKTKTSMISVNQSVPFMIHATFALHRLVPVALCQANRTDFRFPHVDLWKQIDMGTC